MILLLNSFTNFDIFLLYYLCLEKYLKIRAETNRTCISKIKDFKIEIADSLNKLHEMDSHLRKIDKQSKELEKQMLDHIEKYPIEEYSHDLIIGRLLFYYCSFQTQFF